MLRIIITILLRVFCEGEMGRENVIMTLQPSLCAPDSALSYLMGIIGFSGVINSLSPKTGFVGLSIDPHSTISVPSSSQRTSSLVHSAGVSDVCDMLPPFDRDFYELRLLSEQGEIG